MSNNEPENEVWNNREQEREGQVATISEYMSLSADEENTLADIYCDNCD